MVPAICLLLLLAVIAVFAQTARHGFISLDDEDYVSDNRPVRRGLTGEGIAWAITAFHSGNWHPLTWLSHMLDCQIYRLKPGGHHATNVLLHAAAAVLLFLALRRMTGALWPSVWVAAVFAIHPLRVESVAWVAERKDVLSGLLFMLTLWFYARYVERPASWGRYLLVAASFALGLTAKPMLVTLPLVLLLLDYWPLGRWLGAGSGKQRAEEKAVWLVIEKLPLLVLAAASCAVTLAAQRGAMRSLQQVPFPWRVANAVVAYAAYLGKMLYLAGLAVFYPLPKGPPPAWEIVAAASVLLTISAGVFLARRKCPYLLFGWLWYLGTLVPVIGLVQVGDQAMADRYTYLTQIGLYMAMAWGTADLFRVWRERTPWRSQLSKRHGGRSLQAGVSALLLAGLIVCAWQQTRHWRDSETLWTHALACTSPHPLALTSLGKALADRGQVNEAIAYYRKALEIKPDYTEAHSNLALALAGAASSTLGAGRGQAVEAIAEFRKALENEPENVKFITNLGNALAGAPGTPGRGQVEEAIAQYRQALKIQPDYVDALTSLGNAFASREQLDEAIAQYRKALVIDPDFVAARVNLGNALVGQERVDEAITQYQKALEVDPDFAAAQVNLGNALASRDKFDEALVHYRKALELASAHNDRALADAIRAQIRLCQPAAPVGAAQ